MAQLSNEFVYEVIARGTANSQAILNVFHYVTEDDLPVVEPGATEENFLQQFATNWIASVYPKLWDGYSQDQWTLRRLNSIAANPTPPPPGMVTSDFQFAVAASVLDGGDRAGEPLPTYAAVGYRKRTNNPSRNGRGAFRLGPVMEEDTTGGNALNLGAVALFNPTTLENLRRVLITGAGNFPMAMAVFSETLAVQNVGVRPRNFAFQVQTIQLNPFITTQNTRKQRVGAN
jgi:hypothetical protein